MESNLMVFPITALYAGVLAFIMLGLALGAGAARGKHKVSVGDGGNPDLLVAIRRHGNAVEFVPMVLILLALLEANGAGAAWLHGLGAALLIARIAHPLGLSAVRAVHPARIIGAGGTFLVMALAAGYALWQSSSQLW